MHNLEVEAQKYIHRILLRDKGPEMQNKRYRQIRNRYNRYLQTTRENDLFSNTENSVQETDINDGI